MIGTREDSCCGSSVTNGRTEFSIGKSTQNCDATFSVLPYGTAGSYQIKKAIAVEVSGADVGASIADVKWNWIPEIAVPVRGCQKKPSG